MSPSTDTKYGRQPPRSSALHRSSSVDVPRSAHQTITRANSKTNLFERIGQHPIRFQGENGSFSSDGHSSRQSRSTVPPDVIRLSRAMNSDVTPKSNVILPNENDIIREAIEQNLYITYRQPGKSFDCYRIGSNGKCFCGHLLKEHIKYTDELKHLKCESINCQCEAFTYIPFRPEQVGEIWLLKRPGFDLSTWRAKCKCAHAHDRHEPKHKTCKECNCTDFVSNFKCASCNGDWEQHKTFFERAAEREQQNLPTGESYVSSHRSSDGQQMISTASDVHTLSPYLDAAAKRSSQPIGDLRGYTNTLLIPNRATVGNEPHNIPSMRHDLNSNMNSRNPLRGPLRGSHRATEE